MKFRACFLLAVLLTPLLAFAQSFTARQGKIDLRDYHFEDEAAVSLNGEWEFYMSNLITPAQFESGIEVPRDYIQFPQTWNDYSKSLEPGKGYATYRLVVFTKSSSQLSLEIPHCYSNYTIWINGKQVASNGQVGTTADLSVPEWRPQTVSISPVSERMEIVLHISNFHHAKGGIRENILLGHTSALNARRGTAVVMNLSMIGSLIVLAVLFLGVFFLFKSDIAVLSFAALALTWAVRAGFSNLYIFNQYFPSGLSWEVSVKIEYITLYLTMVFALLFLHALFKQDVSLVFKYFFVSCNLIFCLFTIFLDASVYTQFLPVYLSFALLLLLYIVYVVVHAVVYERRGVWLIVGCIMLGVLLFGYDLGAYQGFSDYNSILLNGGYVLIFILMGACLWVQLGFAAKGARKDILTYDDLYRPSK